MMRAAAPFRVNSIMTFMPLLYTGLASPAQVERLVRERLLTPQEYIPGERKANPQNDIPFRHLKAVILTDMGNMMVKTAQDIRGSIRII